jgi:excisionase family DNA binding protein
MRATVTAESLAQANSELRALAAERREAGDLTTYRRIITILARVLACEHEIDDNAESADTVMVNSRQAAVHIGVHPSTVIRMAKQGRLRGAKKTGRDWSIPASAVKQASGYCASTDRPAYRCEICNPPKGGPVR